jgi:PRTRC genetic system ThiF family protein
MAAPCFSGLPYLNQAMLAWGYGDGLEVTLMDGDTVSETNCVRQPFSLSDVGLNKAAVLVHRVNLFWGLQWKAVPHHFTCKGTERNGFACDFVIGCVDSRAARREIDKTVNDPHCRVGYWFDLGNNAASGQYLLGQPLNGRNRRRAARLRTISELYPEIIDVSAGEDPLPSCSAVEALDRQEPFINQTLAASALAMLAQLFRHRCLTYHGGFFNARTGKMSSMPVDPAIWAKARRRARIGKRSATAK